MTIANVNELVSWGQDRDVNGLALNAAREHTDAVDLHIDDVAVDERTDAVWCSRGDQVSGFQRHDRADVRDELAHGEDHVARVSILARRCVHATAYTARRWIQVRHKQRTGGTERIEALRSRPLTILLLKIARGHIVHARVAEDVVERVFNGCVATTFADHDPKLGFVIDVRACGRQVDRVSRSDDRRRRLEEEQRFRGHIVAELRSVRAIIPTDTNDLRRRDRRQQSRVGERDLFVRVPGVCPRCGAQDRQGVRVESREGGLALSRKNACERGHRGAES